MGEQYATQTLTAGAEDADYSLAWQFLTCLFAIHVYEGLITWHVTKQNTAKQLS